MNEKTSMSDLGSHNQGVKTYRKAQSELQQGYRPGRDPASLWTDVRDTAQNFRKNTEEAWC